MTDEPLLETEEPAELGQATGQAAAAFLDTFADTLQAAPEAARFDLSLEILESRSSDPMPDGGREEAAMPYADLAYELQTLDRRMVERINEKESEHETAEWRRDEPLAQIDAIETHLKDFEDAIMAEDLQVARTEAADIANRLLMELSNVPGDAVADGGRPDPPEPNARNPGQYPLDSPAHFYAKATQLLERGALADDADDRYARALDLATQCEKLAEAAAREVDQ